MQNFRTALSGLILSTEVDMVIGECIADRKCNFSLFSLHAFQVWTGQDRSRVRTAPVKKTQHACGIVDDRSFALKQSKGKGFCHCLAWKEVKSPTPVRLTKRLSRLLFELPTGTFPFSLFVSCRCSFFLSFFLGASASSIIQTDRKSHEAPHLIWGCVLIHIAKKFWKRVLLLRSIK